jgi:ribonuclease BN (tRNA processing enzyme)
VILQSYGGREYAGARVNRRQWLYGAVGVCAAAIRPLRLAAQSPRTRLILLGTAGGPRPKKSRAAPSQAIVLGETTYVIDCGDGVARQLALADVPLTSVRHLFITHQHSDHNADYGNLLLLAWAAGLKTRVDTWGPPPIDRMTTLFFDLNAYDITTRIADEGRVALAPLVHVHELTRGGTVMQDDHVKVTAALVSHPPVVPSFAYRFDTADRSIVISGDTAGADNLIALARGADILVHEVLYVPAVDRLVASVPNASTLKRHIVDSHTSAEDCGRIAQAAGVETLVLSHFVPAEDPLVRDEMWLEAARTHFRGRIILGKDLMEL